MLCESLHELLRDHLYSLDSLYLLSNLMPTEKYVKNGYITEEEFIYTIQETASRLGSVNALELTLGLKQLQTLKKALSRRLRDIGFS